MDFVPIGSDENETSDKINGWFEDVGGGKSIMEDVMSLSFVVGSSVDTSLTRPL